MKRAKPYRIERLDQILSLSAPARQEIIDALHVTGPASVAGIGSHLGRAADSLYHHIRILLRVGLVVEVEKRRPGLSDKAIYDIPGKPMHIAYNFHDEDISNGIAEVTASMLRITERDFRGAIQSGGVVGDGPNRNIRGARMKGRLDAVQVKELNRHIEEIRRIFSSPKAGNLARVHTLTLVLSPSESPADESHRK